MISIGFIVNFFFGVCSIVEKLNFGKIFKSRD